ncbi:MAG TPA: acetyl-CoA carboxylase biotin carboxylase subunit [Methylomirabilota bacterium]|jgi:acetyl-CoA carboxylase biotin carboxylase subunit|nr:acetyl-CoA carboxylase biotin carboxylase subunit [Methylomirabilota bacterium]
MFAKLLVANRGEIAVRVIRACRDAGIRTVAVYSDADREALHVRLADEAYPIGPAPAAQSYLAIDRLIDVARRAGAQAVHPGYGFLAENARFAEACRAAGLTFVGPPPEAIAAMGDKTAARRTAATCGVPLVPGTREPVGSDDEAARAARELGYPVMIKATLGGGGKGMRLVANPGELGAALRLARSEAASAFGDAGVYLEKTLAEPRHIEIQVLADADGHVVHLGERECSIQRRHQKLVEEAPSPLVDPPLRRAMGEAACRLVAAVGYRNAGTVEFLVDAERRFYFLEVNTRLQVEHPVTELVTGLDLVREQLRLAAGEPLGYTQGDVIARGWAIECRISAEDPAAHFRPSPGRITAWRPPAGPWVRVDAGVYEGAEVPIHYDPLMAKLIVWGRDRGDAIRRMAGALAEFGVAGVRTTIPFHAAVMVHPDFVAGRLSTAFVERMGSGLVPRPDPARARVAMIAAALHAYRQAGRAWRSAVAPGPSAWALAARPRVPRVPR